MADPDSRRADPLDGLLERYLDLDRRFQDRGGVGSLLNAWAGLRQDLERVALAELEAMAREIREVVTALLEEDRAQAHRVIDALLKMDAELRGVRQLKVAFGAAVEPGIDGATAAVLGVR